MEVYGCIDVDSEYAKSIGFTSDKFDGWLWRKEGETRIMVSFIKSTDPGKGNLSRLFDAVHAQGLAVAVPTPLGKMQAILTRKGFSKAREFCEDYGESVEVWTLEPPKEPVTP